MIRSNIFIPHSNPHFILSDSVITRVCILVCSKYVTGISILQHQCELFLKQYINNSSYFSNKSFLKYAYLSISFLNLFGILSSAIESKACCNFKDEASSRRGLESTATLQSTSLLTLKSTKQKKKIIFFRKKLKKFG